MGIRKYKPTTPGRRGSSVSDFVELTRSTPEKSLLVAKPKTGGRNNTGRITTRHIGGGHKQAYRIIDFKRYDKDGVPDWEDQCPNQPETINGVKDDDGCPDEGKSKVRLEAKRIVILDKVYFATNKDVILPKSFDLLNQVAAILRANPQIELLRVEGHTDNQGKPAKNQNLSERRAARVRAFLIKEGVAAERLESVGYGQTKPVDTNKTAAGRENNRRVEFNILKVAGEDTEQAK